MYQKLIIRNIAQTVQYQCLVMIALDACFEVRYTYLLSMEEIRSVGEIMNENQCRCRWKR